MDEKDTPGGREVEARNLMLRFAMKWSESVFPGDMPVSVPNIREAIKDWWDEADDEARFTMFDAAGAVVFAVLTYGREAAFNEKVREEVGALLDGLAEQAEGPPEGE